MLPRDVVEQLKVTVLGSGWSASRAEWPTSVGAHVVGRRSIGQPTTPWEDKHPAQAAVAVAVVRTSSVRKCDVVRVSEDQGGTRRGRDDEVSLAYPATTAIDSARCQDDRVTTQATVIRASSMSPVQTTNERAADKTQGRTLAGAESWEETTGELELAPRLCPRALDPAELVTHPPTGTTPVSSRMRVTQIRRSRPRSSGSGCWTECRE